MRDAEIAERIASMRAALDTIEARYRQARANLYDWSGLGYPARSMGGPGRSGNGSHADPVGVVAARAMAMRDEDRDRYRIEYDSIGTLTSAGVKLLEKVADICTAATVTARAPGVPGCQPCAALTLRPHQHDCDDACRARDHAHADGWQRIYQRLHPLDDPESSELVPYCSWHVEFIQRYGVEPDHAIVLWHLDHLGEKIPRQLIRDHHPVEYEQYQASLATRPSRCGGTIWENGVEQPCAQRFMHPGRCTATGLASPS